MEDQVEIVEYLSEIKNVSPRSSLVIAGASFYLQYKRTRSLPIDSTSTWNSLEKATRYAQNIDTVAYAPYDGQMITVKENGKTNVYILVLDESLPLADKRVHCKLEPVASQSFGDDRYARKDIKDTFKKGFTSKEGCDIEGGLNVGKMTRLSGGVVVMADTDYGVTESEKENPENSNVMAIGLTEVPKYNPQIQISAESETKRSIFREKDKTKRSKKESAQHSKSRNKSFVMTSVSAL